MKRVLFVSAALAALVGFGGCACTHGAGAAGMMRGSCARAPHTCATSNTGTPGLFSRLCPHGTGRGRPGPAAMQSGPPTGTIAYPYYTTRGPRDFLAADPPTIGP